MKTPVVKYRARRLTASKLRAARVSEGLAPSSSRVPSAAKKLAAPIKKRAFRCKLCKHNVSFDSADQLARHVWKRHRADEVQKLSARPEPDPKVVARWNAARTRAMNKWNYGAVPDRGRDTSSSGYEKDRIRLTSACWCGARAMPGEQTCYFHHNK